MYQSEWMHSFRSLMTKVQKGHIRFSKWLPRLCQLSQQLPCCTTITAIKGIDSYLWTLKGFIQTFIVEAQANFLSEISFSLKLHHDARILLCLTQVGWDVGTSLNHTLLASPLLRKNIIDFFNDGGESKNINFSRQDLPRGEPFLSSTPSKDVSLLFCNIVIIGNRDLS